MGSPATAAEGAPIGEPEVMLSRPEAVLSCRTAVAASSASREA